MKKILMAVVIMITFMSCAAPGHHYYGLNGGPKEGVEYKFSTGNIILGVFLAETIIAPVYIGMEYLYVSKEPVLGAK